jgi:hypothetical protein
MPTHREINAKETVPDILYTDISFKEVLKCNTFGREASVFLGFPVKVLQVCPFRIAINQ